MHFFQQILEDLGIRYTVPYAKQMFESRSDSNSLYGIKKMLESLGCSSSAIKAQAPIDLEYPCICMYHGYYSVLKKEPEDVKELFTDDSDVIALIITDTDGAQEPDYLLHRLQLLLQFGMPYFTGALAAFLVVMAFFPSLFADSSAHASSMQTFFSKLSGESAAARFDWLKLSLVVLNGVGIFFSYRTVARECSGTCHNVLESPASKLFGIYSLGVIGLSYFISSLLIALFIPSMAPALALISCAALIMPLWSISYQAFVVRSWCQNCLGVQGALILMFAAELLLGKISFGALHWAPALSAIAIYFVVFYVCDKFYALVQKEKSYPKNLLVNYSVMMKDAQIREQIISSGTLHSTSGASTVTLGDPFGREILLIISPFCSHCRDTFMVVKRIFSEKRLEGWKLSIVFSQNSFSLPVYGSAVYEYQKNGEQALIDFLSAWYASFKINKARKSFKAINDTAPTESLSALHAELNRQKTWLADSRISSTPVMLVDGHEVSALLLEDLVQKAR